MSSDLKVDCDLYLQIHADLHSKDVPTIYFETIFFRKIFSAPI